MAAGKLQEKNMKKNCFLESFLKVTEESSRIRSRVQIH